MIHSTKIGVAVRDDLLIWQKLNVTAFLASGIVASSPETIGKEYRDGSGLLYLPLLSQPVLVYACNLEQLRRTLSRANNRGIKSAIYISQMFQTGNDTDNRYTVELVGTDDLDLVGIAFRADNKTFDKIVSGLKLHQ